MSNRFELQKIRPEGGGHEIYCQCSHGRIAGAGAGVRAGTGMAEAVGAVVAAAASGADNCCCVDGTSCARAESTSPVLPAALS